MDVDQREDEDDEEEEEQQRRPQQLIGFADPSHESDEE